jgi:integrase
MAVKRSYGTGSLFEKKDSAGRVSYYGQWRRGDQQIKRRLGPKRLEGTREGLSKTQAETLLRKLMAEVQPPARKPVDVLTIGELGERYLTHLEKMKRRKLSTRTAVKSTLRVHLEPYFGERGIATVTREDVEDLRTVLEGKVGPKSVRNYLGTLSALYRYAMNPARKWANVNPCEGVELPDVPDSVEIRYLELDQVDALTRHAHPGEYEQLDRVLYRTAAMTGMREGELIALRWRDVAWGQSVIRVRQNYVLNEFGTPKSKRSTRAVPMADQVAGELERYYKANGEPDDDALVFGDPTARRSQGKLMPIGSPLDKAALLRRFRKALKAAKLDEARRFHDLRHTFGTQMAAAGVPMRTLQEWMGHRDIKTTERYVDYAPRTGDAQLVAAAFSRDAVAPAAALGITVSNSEAPIEAPI